MSCPSDEARGSSEIPPDIFRLTVHKLTRDSRGVEGIPLKLVITMVVLALSLPALFGWLYAYDGSQLRSALQATVSRLTQYAESAYASPESRRCLDVPVPTGTFVRARHVRIGGAEGDSFLRESIAYQVERENEFATTVAFPLNSSAGQALYLSPRSIPYDVCFIRRLDCQGQACAYVQVEVAV